MRLYNFVDHLPQSGSRKGFWSTLYLGSFLQARSTELKENPAHFMCGTNNLAIEVDLTKASFVLLGCTQILLYILDCDKTETKTINY